MIEVVLLFLTHEKFRMIWIIVRNGWKSNFSLIIIFPIQRSVNAFCDALEIIRNIQSNQKNV